MSSFDDLNRRLDLTKAALLLTKHGFPLSSQHQRAIGIGDDDEEPTFGFNLRPEVPKC